jgi:hypothetical protein
MNAFQDFVATLPLPDALSPHALAWGEAEVDHRANGEPVYIANIPSDQSGVKDLVAPESAPIYRGDKAALKAARAKTLRFKLADKPTIETIKPALRAAHGDLVAELSSQLEKSDILHFTTPRVLTWASGGVHYVTLDCLVFRGKYVNVNA